MDDSVRIRDCAAEDRTEALKPLIKLHGDYKQGTCPQDLFELTRDRDLAASFRRYLEEIHREATGRWKILVAEGGVYGREELDSGGGFQ